MYYNLVCVIGRDISTTHIIKQKKIVYNCHCIHKIEWREPKYRQFIIRVKQLLIGLERIFGKYWRADEAVGVGGTKGDCFTANAAVTHFTSIEKCAMERIEIIFFVTESI